MLLRPAEPADAMGVARVHVRAWQVAYRNLLPDDYLDSLQARRSRATLHVRRHGSARADDDCRRRRCGNHSRLRHDVCGARRGRSRLRRARGDSRRSGLVGPRRRRGAARFVARASARLGIQARAPVGARRQRSRRALLRPGRLGAGRLAAQRIRSGACRSTISGTGACCSPTSAGTSADSCD